VRHESGEHQVAPAGLVKLGTEVGLAFTPWRVIVTGVLVGTQPR
jgi:hypothetical protein